MSSRPGRLKTGKTWPGLVDPDSAAAADGRTGIWTQQHESMDLTCLVSTVQGGGGDELGGSEDA